VKTAACGYGRAARALDLAVGHTRRNDPIGRLALLDPLLERSDRIEGVGAFTAAAMAHAGTMNRRTHSAVFAAPPIAFTTLV